MSTLLIWSDEIQKLSDLIKENKKLPSMFDKFTVLGTELRISEYNKLRQLPIPDDKLDLSTALPEKRDTLLFVLGMLKERKESRVCTISSVPRDMADFAKEQEIELLSMAAAAKNSDKKVSKPRAPRKTAEPKGVKELKNEDPEPVAAKEEETPMMNPPENTPTDELLEKLVKIAEEKTGCEYSKRMNEIKKAVTNASDKEIGLPFQLKMLFGEDGKALSEELTEHYEELKN